MGLNCVNFYSFWPQGGRSLLSARDCLLKIEKLNTVMK